ncbi:histidine phosphatase family protein [Flavimaricola marinus]|uniref:Phosphoserine phosphatase 1 n=1 Tax=Flavimaricola marinus TaxID=1819565 RepID=A0A238LG62_9RHOB|nr:histidine phosphatase family protein [Flavimaricola marinus]SMY07880.1 Phosphoserine phosphatase 1 [Flavimaricola marinus]
MNLPELFVIRHGETEWNRESRWQGDLDSPLTEQGRVQARAVGAILRREGITPATHRFYASPLGRARKTAELILGTVDGIIEDARLREISVGQWTGLSRDQIRAQSDLPEDAHFLDYYASAPGGEPIEHLFARAEAFLGSLTGPSVLVTHGITSRVLRTAAMGWGPDRLNELPGGQGVVHHVLNRQHAELHP